MLITLVGLLVVFLFLIEIPAGTAQLGPEIDSVPPTIEIAYCSEPIVEPGIITVRGRSSDQESGISKVEGFSHTYPFDNQFPFKLAVPANPGDWSEWSMPLEIFDTRTRALIRATDNSGNENWDEIFIDINETQNKLSAAAADKSVAFVDPSFTAAAYNVDSFYSFYAKYRNVTAGQNITSDLNFMTGDIPGPDRAYMEPFVESVKKFAPDHEVVILTDTDVHDGLIFAKHVDESINFEKNAFDVLFLLHDEYVTQQQYDNFRRFVSNGGVLVFLDGNIFYGEVTYDRKYCTATLVKGHDWEFDGESVRRSVAERYFNETREWVGSNFWFNDISDPVTFENNPYNATHFEENYVTNPRATIIHDYEMKLGEDYEGDPSDSNKVIATYELGYGKGKVIFLGTYAEREATNPLFHKFFRNVVLMHALAPYYEIFTDDPAVSFPIYYRSEGVDIADVFIDVESKTLTLTVERSEPQREGSIQLVLPKDVIDVASDPDQNQNEPGEPTNLVVLVDGKRIRYAEYAVSKERVLTVPLSAGAETIDIEIIGTKIVPEFPYLSLILVVTFTVVCIVTGIGKSQRIM